MNSNDNSHKENNNDIINSNDRIFEIIIRYRNQFQALLQFICNLCLALVSLQCSPVVCLFIHAQFMHIGSRRIYEHAAEPSANISDFLQLTLIYLCLLFHSRMPYILIIKKWHVCLCSLNIVM